MSSLSALAARCAFSSVKHVASPYAAAAATRAASDGSSGTHNAPKVLTKAATRNQLPTCSGSGGIW